MESAFAIEEIRVYLISIILPLEVIVDSVLLSIYQNSCILFL